MQYMDSKNFNIEYKNQLSDRTRFLIEDIDEDNTIQGVFSMYNPVEDLILIQIGEFNLELPVAKYGSSLFEDFRNLMEFIWSPTTAVDEYSKNIYFDPHSQKLYSIIIGDFMINIPILLFVFEKEDVLIYTRTLDNTDTSKVFLLKNRDSFEPVKISLKMVEQTIAKFLIEYFEVVNKSFTNIQAADGYSELSNFIKKLKK